MMILRINGLRFYAYHGVMPREQKVGQQFEVDLRLEVSGYDGSDSLEHTVNYADVISVVKEEMEIPSKLIEHVCARICQRLRADFPAIAGGSVKVSKLHPPVEAELTSASVELDINTH